MSNGVIRCNTVSYGVIRFHKVSYGVTRCHTVSYGVLRCHTVSYGVFRCHTVSCGVLRCHTVSYGVLRCHTVSYGVIRCHTASYFVLRCLTVSYGVLRCLTMSYGVLRCLTVSYGVTRCHTTAGRNISIITITFLMRVHTSITIQNVLYCGWTSEASYFTAVTKHSSTNTYKVNSNLYSKRAMFLSVFPCVTTFSILYTVWHKSRSQNMNKKELMIIYCKMFC